MNQDEVSIISDIFCGVIGLAPSELNDGIAYNSIESWDSLKHLELVGALEERFRIELDTDDIIAMENFGKVKTILGKYLNKN
jgi:acyl carrier protein